MKRHLQFFSLIVMLVFTQACGPKKEKETASDADTTTMSNASTTMVATKEDPAAKKARLQKSREEIEQKRMAAYDETGKTTPTYKDPSGHVVYNVVQTKPVYKGGNEEMEKYLRENLKYPTVAIEKSVEGTVFVDFVVGADGKVRDVSAVEVSGDNDASLRDEAVRVVANMPGWSPGVEKGKPVDTKFSLPITFNLPEGESAATH